MSDNNQALKDAGLKVTLPRLKILEVLQQPECQHISAEELYKKLIDLSEEIGLAQCTVFSTNLMMLVSSLVTILKAASQYLSFQLSITMTT